MKKIFIILGALILLAVAFVAGAQYMRTQMPTAQDQTSLVNEAVAATLNAMPTVTSAPTFAPLPTSTPQSLNGYFCEYGFCIGHPTEINFFDVSSVRNAATPSNYNYGILAGFNVPNIFIQMAWTLSGSTSDPSVMMRYVLEEGDTLVGSVDGFAAGDLTIFYQPLTSTVSSSLPYGGAGAWTCGGRDFAWKVYLPLDNIALDILKQSLARFSCGN